MYCLHYIATSGSLRMAALPAASEYLKDLDREVIKLGVHLRLSYIKLEDMKKKNVIAVWLREDDNVTTRSGPPSWTSLATALERVGHTAIASKVRIGK